MKKKSVSEQIESFGVIPVIRASSSEEARFAAEAVRSGGIPKAKDLRSSRINTASYNPKTLVFCSTV
jgi:hypothetical protein